MPRTFWLCYAAPVASPDRNVAQPWFAAPVYLATDGTLLESLA